jgi:Protein of unknown function (DUF3866)
MPAFREGKVTAVEVDEPDITTCRVATDDGEIEAAAWPSISGRVQVGDRVVVNTTGIELGLGTGGWGFVLWNLDGSGPLRQGEGHIVKLRYTPLQTEVLAAEEPDSPHHAALREATSIHGMPVVACGLHSQIAGVAAGIKAERSDARVAYVMTDGAALPLSWSGLVRDLKAGGLIDVTSTAGHAFGGDLEAVNVFSALAAVRHAADANVAIVAMGPGVVGTSTALGFTAIEQGQVLDAAAALGGRALACLRICFADERPRHHGLSHHTITALTVAAQRPATVVVPQLPPEQAAEVMRRVEASGLDERHELVTADGGPGLELLLSSGIEASSMGRSPDQIPELWLAAAAVGRVAASFV